MDFIFLTVDPLDIAFSFIPYSTDNWLLHRMMAFFIVSVN